jgi:hypothetical protein
VGPKSNIALSALFKEHLERTYAMKHTEETRSRVSTVRKKEDSCRSDASILKNIRGVVSNADWYATCNQVE